MYPNIPAEYRAMPHELPLADPVVMRTSSSHLYRQYGGAPVDLHDALRRRDERFARELIEEFPRLAFVRDTKERTPMHIAARSRCSAEIIDQLFATGASQDCLDYRERMPLHAAVWGKSFVQPAAITRLLPSMRFSVDQVARNGKSPLFLAVWNDHPAAVQILLEAGANPVQQRFESKDTLLPTHLVTASTAMFDFCERLPLPLIFIGLPIVITLSFPSFVQERIAQPIHHQRVKNKYCGYSPLEIAAKRGNRQIAELLQIAYHRSGIRLSSDERSGLAERHWEPLSLDQILAGIASSLQAINSFQQSLTEQQRQRLGELLIDARRAARDAPDFVVKDAELDVAQSNVVADAVSRYENRIQELEHNLENATASQNASESALRRKIEEIDALTSRIANAEAICRTLNESLEESNLEKLRISEELAAATASLRTYNVDTYLAAVQRKRELEARLAKRDERLQAESDRANQMKDELDQLHKERAQFLRQLPRATQNAKKLEELATKKQKLSAEAMAASMRPSGAPVGEEKRRLERKNIKLAHEENDALIEQEAIRQERISRHATAFQSFLKSLAAHDTLHASSQGSPQVFISYAWEDESLPGHEPIQDAMYQRLLFLAGSLRTLGFKTFLDIESLKGNLSRSMQENLDASRYILLIGTDRLASRIAQAPASGAAFEFGLIERRVASDPQVQFYPLLLRGVHGIAFPPGVTQNLVLDLRADDAKWQTAWPKRLAGLARTVQGCPNVGLIPRMIGADHPGTPRYKIYKRMLGNLLDKLQAIDAELGLG